MAEMESLFSKEKIEKMDKFFAEKTEFFNNNPEKQKDLFNRKGFFDSLSLGDPELYKQLFVKNTRKKVKGHYSPKEDIICIDFEEHGEKFKSIMLEDNVYLDFDENYFPLKLRVTNASRKFEINSKLALKRFGFNMKLSISKKMIKVNIKFSFISRNEKISGTVNPSLIPNNLNIPSMNEEFESAMA